MLPVFKLLHKEVVSLGNLANFGVHTTLEVDEILPSLHSISGVLVSLALKLIEVSHRDLLHDWLLLGTTKHSLHTSVTTL